MASAGVMPQFKSGGSSDRALPRNRITATIVILGGMTVVIGALMPWMTLFGGLHTYRGIIGLYGRLIAVGGGVAVALGFFIGVRDNRLLRLSAGALGGAIFLFSAVLLRNLIALVGDFRGDPMMVAVPGTGLYVCLGGAVLLCGSLITLAWPDVTT